MLPTPNCDVKTLNAYWQEASPYVARPIAAGAAIVVPFRLFVQKTQKQVTGHVSRVPFLEGLNGGIRAAPTLFTLIGSQMIAQKVLEGCLHKMGSGEEGKPANFSTMMLSSALVGAATVHPLAIFTGQTQTPKKGWIESMRLVTPRQAFATAWMETFFILGLRGSGPLCDRMQWVLKEDYLEIRQHSCSFISGVLGAILGHPGDTALTRWQNKLSLNVRQLMQGVSRRAVGVGLYCVFYHTIRDRIETSTMVKNNPNL